MDTRSQGRTNYTTKYGHTYGLFQNLNLCPYREYKWCRFNPCGTAIIYTIGDTYYEWMSHLSWCVSHHQAQSTVLQSTHKKYSLLCLQLMHWIHCSFHKVQNVEYYYCPVQLVCSCIWWNNILGLQWASNDKYFYDSLSLSLSLSLSILFLSE